LGDALAVSLIEAKGFSAENFGTFHPGGKLGSNFLKVKELMRSDKDIPAVKESQTISEVLMEMTSKHLGCTAVLNDNDVTTGIITDGDLRRHISPELFSQTAAQLMTKNPIVTNADTLAVEAIAVMNKKSITSLLVLDEQKKVVGILHLHDCLRSGVV
jgi:arabinose-5-phosphate isomerase